MPTRPIPVHRCHAAAIACALASSQALPAHADCIDNAAARHQVNAVVLRAIGWQESRLQPQALRRNANGSIDVGAFQINSVHLTELGRYGIDRAALADGCTSAEVAAWHYRRQMDRRGNSWRAVGAYHSATPERAAWYANRIAAILMRWQALPAGALPFPPEDTLAPSRPDPLRASARLSTTATPPARATPSTRPTAARSRGSRPSSPSPSRASMAAASQAATAEPLQAPGTSQSPAPTRAPAWRELAYLPPGR